MQQVADEQQTEENGPIISQFPVVSSLHDILIAIPVLLSPGTITEIRSERPPVCVFRDQCDISPSASTVPGPE